MFYLLFIIPLFLSIAAVKTNIYFLKAMVTISCMAILLLANPPLGREAGMAGGVSLFMLSAFFLSIIGDFFLSTREEGTGKKSNYFLYGIGFFFLAHGAYLLFSSQLGVLKFVPLILILIPICVYFFIRVINCLDRIAMKIAVFFYIIISCFSLAWIIGAEGVLFARIALTSGIGLILISDIFIAETDFCGKKQFGKFVLPLYYAAHMMLTLGVLLSL